MKLAYMDIFEDLGIAEDTYKTLASGGDFTKDFSHEFQTLLPQGEDTIYLDRKNRIAYNKEIINEENEQRLGVKFDELEQVSASEIGNIFPLNLKFSESFNLTYTAEDGSQKPVYMGCYGIGTSRLMGVIAEKFADEKGLVWPESVAPAKYHIVTLLKDETDESYELSKELFNVIGENAIWDKRLRVGAGEKLKDADLIGCPYRIIVSSKSIMNGGFEIKGRKEESGKIMTIDQLLNIEKR
jgi:prolyl-tRNA synthetase